MSGKVLLDTNAIIYALNDGLVLPSSHYCISIITEMELFSYPKLTNNEHQSIENLLTHFDILNISDDVKSKVIYIRKKYGIKLPDSIICATAMVNNATLISNDKQLSKILDLNVLTLDKFI